MKTNKALHTICTVLAINLFSFAATCEAETTVDTFKHPFYIGFNGGYGATTWQGLVPLKQNDAMFISTPTHVVEGGAVWGAFAGYEFMPYFALEASYMRYPNATVSFDPSSLFSFEHDGLTVIKTHTETMSAMAKIMLIIPQTKMRAYSGAGIAGVHRYDNLSNCWRASPTFGVGLNYNLTDHWMAEFSLSYTAGYGESELNPAKDYVPFLYSAFLGVGYRFSMV